jgi:hypothetical protein
VTRLLLPVPPFAAIVPMPALFFVMQSTKRSHWLRS